MIEYKISENQLNLLLEAINCHQDEYREAKFDKNPKQLRLKVISDVMISQYN